MSTDLDTVCYCPFHEGPIVSSCTLEHCDFWITTPPLNCSYVAYREHHSLTGSEELSWSALGQILNSESSDIETWSKHAYELLRRIAVQEQIPAEWSLLKNSQRCVVCDKPAKIFDKGWGWCSAACHQWLPPAAVEVEARWGVWFRRILSQWSQVNTKTLERLTGLHKHNIHWLLWQHLGWTPEDPSEVTEWYRHQESLLPNPSVPTVKELLQRLKIAQQWGGGQP